MRRRMLAISAGLMAFALSAAMAATLGGLDAANLGAETSVVAGCDTDGITVDFTTTFDTDEGAYIVSSVDFSGVAAECNGQDIDMTLTGLDSGNVIVLGDSSGTVSGTSFSVDVSSEAILAEDVLGIAVVISG